MIKVVRNILNFDRNSKMKEEYYQQGESRNRFSLIDTKQYLEQCYEYFNFKYLKNIDSEIIKDLCENGLLDEQEIFNDTLYLINTRKCKNYLNIFKIFERFLNEYDNSSKFLFGFIIGSIVMPILLKIIF